MCPFISHLCSLSESKYMSINDRISIGNYDVLNSWMQKHTSSLHTDSIPPKVKGRFCNSYRWPWQCGNGNQSMFTWQPCTAIVSPVNFELRIIRVTWQMLAYAPLPSATIRSDDEDCRMPLLNLCAQKMEKTSKDWTRGLLGMGFIPFFGHVQESPKRGKGHSRERLFAIHMHTCETVLGKRTIQLVSCQPSLSIFLIHCAQQLVFIVIWNVWKERIARDGYNVALLWPVLQNLCFFPAPTTHASCTIFSYKVVC